MTIWALVNSVGEVEVRYERGDAPPDTLPKPSRPGFRWMKDNAPTFDSATQRLTVVAPVADDAAEVPYAVIAIPQAELDARANQAIKAQLVNTDKDFSRIGEDLINALVAGGTLTLNQLPQAARDKLAARAALRAQLK